MPTTPFSIRLPFLVCAPGLDAQRHYARLADSGHSVNGAHTRDAASVLTPMLISCTLWYFLHLLPSELRAEGRILRRLRGEASVLAIRRSSECIKRKDGSVVLHEHGQISQLRSKPEQDSMAATQHAWAVVEHGKPLQKIEIPIPEPVETQVLIKVTHCGVCHSDLHFWEGSYDVGGGKRMYVKDRGATLPRALGHEILGTVAGLGPGVDSTTIGVGSNRAVYPWVGCQQCSHCENENDNLCLGQRIRGIFSDGGFAQYITVPHPRYLVDYGNIDPSIACTFGCSGLTVLSSIEKIMPLKPHEPVLLIGAGGLGLACISMLQALGHKNIITTDLSAEKLQAARSAGATAVVDSTNPDPVSEIIQVSKGPLPAAIDFVGNKQTAELAMACVGKGGRVVEVGIMGGEMSLSLVPFTFGAKSILGNITGTPRHLREVVEIAKRGKLNAIPITKVPWDNANDALQQLHEGKVTGRLVLIH